MVSSSTSDYEVQCTCGRVLHGRRERLAQQVACPACGEPVFVLPRDGYPPFDSTPETSEPHRRRPRRGRARKRPQVKSREQARDASHSQRRARGQRSARSESTDVSVPPEDPQPLDDLFQDEQSDPDAVGEPDTEQPRDVALDELAGETGRPRRMSAPQPTDAVAKGSRIPAVLARISPVKRAMIGIVAAVAMTAVWVHHRHQREQAIQEFRSSRQRGLDALAERDWPTALAEFSEARAAADVLELDDQQSRLVDQLWAETRACDELATLTLLDALSQLDIEPGTAEDFSDQLGSLLRNSWLLFDTFGRLDPEEQRVLIDFPLDVQGVPVVLETTSPLLRQHASTETPRRSIFAAQVAACRYDVQPRRQLLVTLRSDSLVLWTSPEILETLGLVESADEFHPASESLADVLARQATELNLK